jgi:hypothetical protein
MAWQQWRRDGMAATTTVTTTQWHASSGDNSGSSSSDNNCDVGIDSHRNGGGDGGLVVTL